MKFHDSNYVKLWKMGREGREILDTILKDPELLRANHTFWTTKFAVDPQITPTNAEGEAIFKSTMRPLTTGSLMDMRAPLGDSIVEDKKGMAYYTGVIPDFITKGTVEKATERLHKEKLFDQFGDARLIAMYVTDVLQSKLDSANQTLSHMGAYLLSHGNLSYLVGQGIQDNLYKAAIPAENFDTAGAGVWSDKTTKILTQMVEKEEKFKEKWGVDMPMQWEITRKQFREEFMPNEQVINWVKHLYVIKNGVELTTALGVTEDMAIEAVSKYPGLSPIVFIEEKQNDLVLGTVSGWKEGVAVLRPSGYAGYIRHTSILDDEIFTKFGNKANSYNFSKTLNGLLTIMNSTVINGNFQEWHTDGMMAAIPTLDEFLYHVIIDTTEADA
jgi:hypothetical protein